MAKLTNKQQMFVKEYLIDLNATQAAIRAGYSVKTAEVIGYENLNKPQIANAIQEAMDKRSEKTEITGNMVLQELAKMGFANIQNIFDDRGRLLPVCQLPADVAASISSIKVSTKTIPGTDPVEVEHISEIKLWDKRGSLDLLGKNLKLWNDVGSKENPFTLEQLVSGE